MARFFRHYHSAWWRKGSTIFLAFSWILGLLFGFLFYHHAGTSYTSLMRGATFGSVSIVGLLCVSVLPFLLSAFAVYISKPALLLVVSFGKAFLFSLVSIGVILEFNSIGWLIRQLLMFSILASVPVLYWYWNRHISGDIGFCGAEFLLVISVCCLIGSIDYRYISPFLANLINS